MPTALEVIGEVLAALPDGTLACSLNERCVACYWTERAGSDEATVAGIEANLTRLKAFICAHFAAIEDVDEHLKDS